MFAGFDDAADGMEMGFQIFANGETDIRVDCGGDSLDAAAAGEPTNISLGDAVDVVSEDLPV